MPDNADAYFESLKPDDDDYDDLIWQEYLATTDSMERLEKGLARQQDWVINESQKHLQTRTD